MTVVGPKCAVCYDDAIHEIPTVLCDACFVHWIEDGDWVIDTGCPSTYKRFNDHVDGCELCCSEQNDFNYCTIGVSLSGSWLETIDFGE